jgi:hypothetical protein
VRDRLVALGASLTLIAGVIGVLTLTGDRPGWDKRVLPLVHFVEKERGLRFKNAVPVSFLSDKDFQTHVTSTPQEDAADTKQLGEYVGRLRALDLLHGTVDVRKAENDLRGSSVVGLYVPSDKAVFVRGAALTAYVRTTLVHELTHVLQDQYFDLTKLRKHVVDTTAVTALIEGDAVRIQEKYQATLSLADTAEYNKELRSGLDGAQARTTSVPEVLTDSLSFPYVFGPVFLDSLGDRVDAAFRHPPTAEAQILDPTGHPFNVDPVPLPDPVLPAGAVAFGDIGPFGQVFLLEVLGSRLPYDEAYRAVAGWVGDTSVGYRIGPVVCNAADVRTTSVAALAAAARRWASFVRGAVVTVSGDTVSLRSCDPGKAAVAGMREPSAFAVLAVRASLIHALFGQRAPLAVATCTADKVLADYRGAYAVLVKNTLTPAEQSAIRDRVVAGVAACR